MARGFGAAQLREIILGQILLGGGEHGLEMGDAVEDRTHLHQRIIRVCQMRAHTRPWPFLRRRDKAGAHRIQADIPHGAVEVIVVENDRGKAALEEMSRPAAARVDEVGITAVRLTHGQTECICLSGNENQVNMVRHQAVGPYLHFVPGRLRGKKIEIDGLIAFLKEDRLSSVTALGDMMRPTRNNDSGKPSHAAQYIAD